jgi:hypothetical protein
MKNAVFWDVAPCRSFVNRRFGGTYSLHLHGRKIRGQGTSVTQSQSYITTDGQSASLSWNKAPNWGLRPDLCYCQRVAGSFMWGALSDERTGL